MSLLLDSEAVIDWLTESRPTWLDRQLEVGQFGMSVISLMEVLEGTRENDPAAHDRLNKLISVSSLYPITEPTARVAAAIRRGLRSRKAQKSHRSLDILIAATAIEHDLILVTRNIRHFHDIEGLRILANDPS